MNTNNRDDMLTSFGVLCGVIISSPGNKNLSDDTNDFLQWILEKIKEIKDE